MHRSVSCTPYAHQTLRCTETLGWFLASVAAVIAAEIWHWWIGVILVAVAILATLGLVAGYLKSVTAKQYPNRRQRREG